MCSALLPLLRKAHPDAVDALAIIAAAAATAATFLDARRTADIFWEAVSTMDAGIRKFQFESASLSQLNAAADAGEAICRQWRGLHRVPRSRKNDPSTSGTSNPSDGG